MGNNIILLVSAYHLNSKCYLFLDIGNGQSLCTEGSVYLQFGSVQREGTVQVCVNGVWGTVCSNGWDSRDAAVVCNQLGFQQLGKLTL